MMTRGGMRRFVPVNLFLLSLSLLSCSTSGGANSSCLDGSARLRSLNTVRAADGIPTITSISTQRGPAEGAVQGGTPVFVRGSNFGADTVVLFGDKASPCTLVQDPSFIIAEAGPVLLSGLVDVTVTTGGQIAVEPNGFRFTPLLAFSSDRTGNFEIFTMSIGGFNIKQVTNNALGQQGQQPAANEINESPAFSPDGKDIVYVSNKSGDKDIFIAGRTGTNPIDLTQNDAATDKDPAFSPDGNSIVFASNLNSVVFSNPDGDFEIFRMNRDGSNIIRLTANAVNDSRPSYSPDGSKIVFASERTSGETDLFIMDSLDGSNEIALPSGADIDIDPIYSPDGTQVIFTRDQTLTKELWVVNSDGSGFPTQLTFGEANAERPVFLPSRGDDKVRLLFQQTAEAKSEILKLTCTGTTSPVTRFIFLCESTIASDNISLHVNSDNDPSVSP